MKQISIINAVKIVNQRVKPFDGEKEYLATGGLVGDNIVTEKVTYKDKPSRADLLAKENQLIVAKMKGTNKVFLVDNNISDYIFSTGFLVLEAKENWSPNFLFHLLQSKYFQEQKDKFSSGATQKAINNEKFKEILIPDIPLEDQKRIAKILDQASILIQKRKQAIELLDEYLKSVFLEMFGDPILNPKRWECLTLEKACDEIYRYPTFYGFKYVKEGIPVIKIGNILSNGIVDQDLSNYDFISKEINILYPRTIIELYDVLMAVRGDGSTVKRVGLVTSPKIVGANISPNLLRFKTNQNIILPHYFFSFVTSPQGQSMFEKYITKTAKKTITAKDIKKIIIPIPSLDLQDKFSKITLKTEKLKQQMCIQLDNLKDQFQSLMQKAFKGELLK